MELKWIEFESAFAKAAAEKFWDAASSGKARDASTLFFYFFPISYFLPVVNSPFALHAKPREDARFSWTCERVSTLFL